MGTVSTISKRQSTQFLNETADGAMRSATKPEPPVLTDQDFDVQILASLQDMADFESQWRDLENRAAKPSNIFQSFDWCMNWAQTCTADNDCYGIHIITVSRNDKCLLIWPMMATCAGPFHILNWLSEPWSQYGDVLAHDNNDLEAILNIAWQKLQTHPFADSIRLRHVRQDATVAQFLQNHARHDGQTDYAPFLEIKKFPTEAAYETRYNKAQRRRRKRIRKNLEQFGPLIFSTDTNGGKFLHTLKQAITEKRKWLAIRGLYSKPVMGPELEEFFAQLADNGKTVKMNASQLNAGEREISYEIGLRYKNHHFGYITAHDARLTNASPGRLHMDLSQRATINDGLDAFDLMVPADPHKETWSSNRVQTRDYFTHLNTRGAIYTTLYLKAIRPGLRWLYLKAPTAIRRHITRFAS